MSSIRLTWLQHLAISPHSNSSTLRSPASTPTNTTTILQRNSIISGAWWRPVEWLGAACPQRCHSSISLVASPSFPIGQLSIAIRSVDQPSWATTYPKCPPLPYHHTKVLLVPQFTSAAWLTSLKVPTKRLITPESSNLRSSDRHWGEAKLSR